MAFTTETGNQDDVILLDKVETTVLRDEGGDFLAVLGQLDTDTFTDSRVRLLSFNTDLKFISLMNSKAFQAEINLLYYLLKNDSSGMGSASKRIGLPAGSQVSFLVVKISPDLVAAILHVLTRGTESTGLTHCDFI